MSEDELLADFYQRFPHNRATAALLLSVIDLIREVRPPDKTYSDLEAFFAEFPRVLRYPNGDPILQLAVAREDPQTGRLRTHTIRGHFNRAVDFFREEHKRYDFPQSPHITGHWAEFAEWLDALVGFEDVTLEDIREQVIAHVLGELPSQEYVPPADDRVPTRLFSKLLERIGDFESPDGAVFQAAVYAYYRADAPHLHLDADKVRSGGKRGGRLGDIDGWEGRRRVLSVEAKKYRIEEKDVGQFGHLANEVAKAHSLGVVVAESFSDAARKELAERGLKTIDLSELRRIVAIWDPLKELVAMNSFEFFLYRIEKKTALQQQLLAFRNDPDGMITE